MKRVQLISFIASLGLLAVVLELVRRKSIKERFALLWIFASLAMIIFSLWEDFLEIIATMVGIYYAPAVILPMIIFFVVVLFLYFSVIVTQQSDKIKTLAQKTAILEQRIDMLEEKREESE